MTSCLDAIGFSDLAVAAAVDALRRGEVVGLPTETVYGLAGDALNPAAVSKIFEVKERPSFDPLICHLPGLDWLDRTAVLDGEERELVTALAEGFWPGPLTLVVPRADVVPDLVTSGLDTVGLRMSAHPVFQAVLERFGGPVAAPSANRFGRISPTTGQHVVEELGDRISLVVDAGATSHGIESTIVSVRDRRIRILRNGPVTPQMLKAGGFEVERMEAGNPGANNLPEAPGQLESHYAPGTPMVLAADVDRGELAGKRCGLLAWNRATGGDGFDEVRVLSEAGDLREAAVNLFRLMRELDAAGLDLLVAEPVPDEGLGLAINDRLRRASVSARK